MTRRRRKPRPAAPLFETVDRLPRDKPYCFVDGSDLVIRVEPGVPVGDKAVLAQRFRYASVTGSPLGRIEYRVPARDGAHPLAGRSFLLRLCRYVTPHEDDPVIDKTVFAAVRLPDRRFRLIDRSNARRYREGVAI